MYFSYFQSHYTYLHNTHQILQAEVVVCHHTFHLMELSQMCGIQGLVAEHSVNGEVLSGLESILQQQQHHSI